MVSDKDGFYQVNLVEIVDILLEMECGPDAKTKDESEEVEAEFFEEHGCSSEEFNQVKETRRIKDIG